MNSTAGPSVVEVVTERTFERLLVERIERRQ